MTRRYWTTAEVRTMREIYSDTPNSEIGARLGRTTSAILQQALKLGLRKSPAFLLGPHCRLQPGHATWNKGKPHNPPGSAAARFKKGHRGARQKPIGAIRRERDALMVKIAEPRVWVPLARFVWEKTFGPIPAGAIVRLIDGNPENCEPANLRLVTRAEHIRLNWKPRGPAKKPIRWTAPLRMAA